MAFCKIIEIVKKIGGFQSLGGGGRWIGEKFSGSETILYDTIMVDTCLYAFDQTHRMYNKSEPQCKRWTLVDNDLSM